MDGTIIDENYPHASNNLYKICQRMIDKLSHIEQTLGRLEERMEKMEGKLDYQIHIDTERRKNKLIRAYYRTGLAANFIPSHT